MLAIEVPFGNEVYDESTSMFSAESSVYLELEHSLASLSKWESIHEKPFLGKEEKTDDETLSYVECMIVTPNYPDGLLSHLTQENLDAINAYINAKMTGTTFRDSPGAPPTREIITAELVYYWMTAFNIPFECEHWHLNRLFTLIRVCNIKQSKPKKMGAAEAARQRAELNAQRRKEFNTKG